MEQWQVHLFSPYLLMVLSWPFTSLAGADANPGAVSANMRGTHRETQIRFRVADA